VRTGGIVLCGGRSSRMGRAKAWLPWQGQPMVAHVVGVLHQVVDEVVVVSSRKLELPPLDACVVRDREPERGPLAGIREGLERLGAELAFVTATDAPFLEPGFVRALLSHRRAAAAQIGGFVEALSAVYPRAALPCAEALLAAGRLRPLFLLEAARYRAVPEDELPGVCSVRGFNTPQEYLAAVREVEPEATATLEFLGHARMVLGRRELEVPVGTLAEILAHAEPALELVREGRVTRPFLVSLDGRSFVRDAAIPIGPGEHVIVLDASVGG
jgi:molybdopterin-guanine dinucleotide biosynthesis protein A